VKTCDKEPINRIYHRNG